jgi:hypothetical protein
MTHHIWKGNALTEYTLPLAIVSVLVVAGLTILLPSFRQTMPGLFQGQAPQGNQRSMALTRFGRVPFAQTVTITLENGNTVTLDQFPSDINRMIETVGVDGTTDLLAGNIRSLADQLLAQKEISETEHAQLYELANQGHRIATIQGLLLQAGREAGTNGEQFANTQIQFEGKTYNTGQLSALLGESNNSHPENALRNQSLPTDLLLAVNITPAYNGVHDGFVKGDFLQALNNAWQSGALQNPSVRTVVSELSRYIQFSGQVTASQTHIYLDNSVNRHQQVSFNDLEKNVSDELTHLSSAGICQTGNGTDSGVHCSG